MAKAAAWVSIGFAVGINVTLEQGPEGERGAVPIASEAARSADADRPSSAGLVSLLERLESGGSYVALADELAFSPVGTRRDWLLSEVLEKWGREDPVGALEYADRLGDEFDGAGMLQAVLSNVSGSNFKKVIDWLDGRAAEPSQRSYMIAAACAGLAREDPVRAIEEASGLPEASMRAQAVRSVVEVWSQSDAAGVLDWIRNAPIDSRLQDLYTTAMFKYIEQDPVRAGALIESMQESGEKALLSSQYARYLAKSEPKGAMVWSIGLQSDEARRRSVGVAFDAWATSDLDAAYGYALALPDGNELAPELLRQAAIRMARRDPLYAIATLEDYPEFIKPSVAQHMALALIESDREAFDGWFMGLEAGPLRDGAIKGALYQLRDADPARAFSLAQSVVSRPMRSELLRDAARSWYYVDPLAVESAVSGSDELTDYQKYELLTDLLENGSPMEIVLP